jgi:hypothetical protein
MMGSRLCRRKLGQEAALSCLLLADEKKRREILSAAPFGPHQQSVSFVPAK